jgi:hypothetical protein
MTHALRVAWYRYRATFALQLSGYLSIVLLIGLIGGLAMASVAAGRRTQSSYPTFLASTNPSNLTLAVFQASANAGAFTSLKPAIERLPDVKDVVTAGTLPLIDIGVNGAPQLSSLANINFVSSLDGMTVHQDRLALLQGRLANQRRANEIVMNAGAARILGVHVGQIITFGAYTPAQMNLPDFGSPKVKPVILVHEKLVGIAALNTQLVQDDVDQTYGVIFADAALVRQVAKPLSKFTTVLYGIQLRRGDRGIAKVEHELVGVVPKGEIYEFHVASTVASQVELALKPESVALGAFGAIAALACLILAAQAISRLLRRDERDRDVLRALGASPVILVVEGLVSVLLAVGLGTIVAVVVAVALSPLGPLGPVRPVYPDAGFSVDWTVIGIGVAVLVIGLGAITSALSVRSVTKGARQSGESVPRRSRVALGLQSAGVPVAGVVGVHFALESGRGRSAVPVRSIIGGTVVAVAMVVATLTFASGFSTLISRPPLYGWNWTYLLNPSNDVPPKAVSLLNHDPQVAEWSGADYTDLQIDGVELPILLQSPHAKVSPPILTGHGLETSDQIVLGAATLNQLHKRVGDTVTISLGTKKNAPYYIPPTPLVIVGTATLPAVGYASFVAEHTSMGTGALVPLDFSNVSFQGGNADRNLNGPELVFVRIRSGVSSAGREDMQRIANAANRIFAADKNAQGNSVEVLGVLRPVQIVNYRSIGSTPIFLAAGLALGAVLALGLTLTSSVRRRRRDFALLKTFGFTRRQLASSVAWQATTTALIGVVVGLPLGVVIGRELWTLFARSIYAVPDPTVPLLSVILVGVGTILFANLVAVLPGHSAARTPAALALRAE